MPRTVIGKARRVEAPCPLCGEALGPSDELLHIDHIAPLARGGRTEMSNLQVVHRICNATRKGGQDKILVW